MKRVRSSRAAALLCALALLSAACSDSGGEREAAPVDLAQLRGAPLRPVNATTTPAASSAMGSSASPTGAENAPAASAPPEADSMRPPPLSESSALAASAQPAATPAEGADASSTETKPERSADELAIAKDYRELDFALLSNFEYRQPTAKEWQADSEAVRSSSAKRIPPELMALSGTKVAIEGFMNPIDFDREGVKSFALVHNSIGCCFGMFPRMNEWVSVEMAGERKAEFYSVEPATVYGVLEVGEEFEGAYVVSIFRIKADHVFGTF